MHASHAGFGIASRGCSCDHVAAVSRRKREDALSWPRCHGGFALHLTKLVRTCLNRSWIHPVPPTTVVKTRYPSVSRCFLISACHEIAAVLLHVQVIAMSSEHTQVSHRLSRSSSYQLWLRQQFGHPFGCSACSFHCRFQFPVLDSFVVLELFCHDAFAVAHMHECSIPNCLTVGNRLTCVHSKRSTA